MTKLYRGQSLWWWAFWPGIALTVVAVAVACRLINGHW